MEAPAAVTWRRKQLSIVSLESVETAVVSARTVIVVVVAAKKLDYDVGTDGGRAVILHRRHTPDEKHRFQRTVIRYRSDNEPEMIFRDQNRDVRHPIRVPSVGFPFGGRDHDGGFEPRPGVRPPPRPVRVVQQRQRLVRRVHETDHVADNPRVVPEYQTTRDARHDQYEQRESIHRCPGLGPLEERAPRPRSVAQPVTEHGDHHVYIVGDHRRRPRAVGCRNFVRHPNRIIRRRSLNYGVAPPVAVVTNYECSRVSGKIFNNVSGNRGPRLD